MIRFGNEGEEFVANAVNTWSVCQHFRSTDRSTVKACSGNDQVRQ